MGHIHLGEIPKSKKWDEVINSIVKYQYALLDDNDYKNIVSNEISRNTIIAAENAFIKAKNDLGLNYIFFLLTKIFIASRNDNWANELAKLGIIMTNDYSISEFIKSINITIDKYIFDKTNDISEIAQQTANEVLARLIKESQINLFSNSIDDYRKALYSYSTKLGYSYFGQLYFAIFTYRYINFYLSRVTATYTNKSMFKNIYDINKFNEELALHCFQTAYIVHDFSGEWYSKTQFQQGITKENTAKFIAVAINKMISELKMQENKE